MREETHVHGRGVANVDERLGRWSVVATGAAMLFGVSGLAAYLPGLRVLGAGRTHFIPMAPSTAISLFLLGASLLHARRREGSLAAMAGAALVGVFGVLEVMEHWVGYFTIEHVLVRDAGTLNGVPIAFMSPLTGALLAVAAAAVAARASSSSTRRLRLAPPLAAATTTLSVPMLLGYLLGAPLLYGTSTIPMALTSALGVACLGVGAFCSCGSEAPAVAALFGPSTRARLLRWFLPVTLGAALLGSFGLHVLEGAFGVSHVFDVAALLLIVLLVTALAVARVARFVGRSIDDLDRARLKLEEERAALERQLEQARKLEALGKLAGGVAHDFNNVLAAIFGYSELARDGLPADHPAAACIDEVLQAAERARRLTAQLLAVGRRQVAQTRVLALHEALAGAEQFLRRIVPEEVKLRISVDECVGWVDLDPAQLDQILLNLVSNAAEAMPGGGTVTITARNRAVITAADAAPLDVEPGEYVSLTVADEGVGMAPEIRDRVFVPFFSTKGPKGTGLGLATVHGIVKQAHGSIVVRSEQGRGSELEVLLPRTTAGRSDEAPPPSGERSSRRSVGCILVVDDEEIVRSATRRNLESGGYRVLDVPSGAAALELLERDEGAEVQLVLVDVMMPGLNGKETAEQARRLRPKLGIVFMSGYADDVLSPSDIAGSHTRFVQKPFDRQTLLTKVGEAIAESSTAGLMTDNRSRGR